MAFLAVMVSMPATVMADDFSGGAGDDTFVDNDQPDADNTIEGGGGDDDLDGSGGNDTVVGDDRVNGGNTDFQLDGDNDNVSGGEGSDGNAAQLGAGVLGDGTVHTNAGTATVNGGDDTVDGGGGDDQQVLGDGQASSNEAASLIGGTDTVTGGDGNDFWVHGDGLADCIGCTAIIATLQGGDDIVVDGGDGNDVQVWGDGYTEGSTTSQLLGGNDTVLGGGGDDPSVFGDGFAYGAVTTLLLGGDDDVDGGNGNDTVFGDGVAQSPQGTGTATLTGGVDTVKGGFGNDILAGDGEVFTTMTGGADGILNGANDTLIDGGDGNDNIRGDGSVSCTGVCTLLGGDDIIDGGAGDDEIRGDGTVLGPIAELIGGNDTISGGSDGADLIFGDGRVDGSTGTLNGGDDNITASAVEGSSGQLYGDGWVVSGAAGAMLNLIGGDDAITVNGNNSRSLNGDGRIHLGSSGTATLTGGADTLAGSGGDDSLTGDGTIHLEETGSTGTILGGEDAIDSGAGKDTIVGDGVFLMYAMGGTANLTGGDDVIKAGAGDDTVYGEGYAIDGLITSMVGGNDRLYGEAGNDTIFGQSGNDLLLGGEGDDALDGGTGSDFLCGGSGTNTVKGGTGADLQCAVDDAITVTEDGGTINVAVNEELDDADTADRAGRRFEIISISGDIKAVIDNETGLLTIFEADSDGQIQYRVWLMDGGFETFGTVFVALSRTPEEPEEEEDPPPEVIDPVDVIPVTPVVDPVDLVDPLDPVDPVDPVSPGDVHPNTDEPSREDIPPAIEDPTHKSESVAEFMRGPMAPAVTAGVAGTMMMAVTGGAGVSAGGLAGGAGSSGGGGGAAARGERQGGRGRGARTGGARTGGGGSAPTRYDGTSDRSLLTATGSGIGPGDRSRTWRLLPGRRLIDRASTVLPGVLAPHSPLMARLAVDGAHLRAMFGSLWMVAPALGAVLGILATEASGGRPISPPLWMLIAGAILTTIDAFAGAVAATVYITAGVITGALIDNQPPDLVHSLLVYCGISFLWTSIPLIGSAIRPFRRLGRGDFRYTWDVVADLAIASLLCAWITRSLMGAMDSFAGTETGLPAYADTVALVVLGCVAVRILIEHITTRLYPLRLQSVEALGDLPEPTLLANLSGIAIRTALFAFIGYSFIGGSWHWWAGVALYVIPQVMSALGAEFEKVDAIQRLLPRGITAVFLLLLVAAVVVYFASSRTSSDLETMRWVFMLLALPPAVLAVLEAFTRDGDQETSWTREFLGLGVVAGSAYLAFNGWNL